ncbi:MAG TPA: hypothetical protein VHK88_04225, partial [Aquihabitans sp.]|nr:hypothetical protein [Aquihabitans sp.]
MEHSSTHAGAPRRRSIAAGLLSALLLLAACGGGDDGDSATATTTTAAAETSTTAAGEDEAPADDATDDEATGDEATGDESETETDGEAATSDAGGAEGMPTDEDDAPSGDWIMIRWQTGMDPEDEGFTTGQAEVRLYSIEPSCDDDGCDLSLAGGGEGGSFTLPDLEPVTGDPLVLTAGEDSWTDDADEPPVGCTDELDGPYVDTAVERELTPIRDDDGTIVAL